MKAKHPAKFTDSFLPIFSELLQNTSNVIDPMAGTGKIGLIKEHGYKGVVYANDLEFEWISQAKDNGCDVFSMFDAAKMDYQNESFDAICTSPTYGNRMADSHNARDSSTRNTYTHTLGRKLHEENTGKMQWGEKYRVKHTEIYVELRRILKTNGIFILNVKDHIRKGEIIQVSDFHRNLIEKNGFTVEQHIEVPVRGMRFGENGKVRVKYENIYVFRKM